VAFVFRFSFDTVQLQEHVYRHDCFSFLISSTLIRRSPDCGAHIHLAAIKMPPLDFPSGLESSLNFQEWHSVKPRQQLNCNRAAELLDTAGVNKVTRNIHWSCRSDADFPAATFSPMPAVLRPSAATPSVHPTGNAV
jgi:hypothetical protein